MHEPLLGVLSILSNYYVHNFARIPQTELAWGNRDKMRALIDQKAEATQIPQPSDDSGQHITAHIARCS
jgi:hypothetical protein